MFGFLGWGSKPAETQAKPKAPPKGSRNQGYDIDSSFFAPALDLDEEEPDLTVPVGPSEVHVRQAMELVGKDDDFEVEVELTEEDMNDEALLKELGELEEEVKDTALEALQAKLQEETQKCLALKRANQIEAAKKLLPSIKELQIQIAELEKRNGDTEAEFDQLQSNVGHSASTTSPTNTAPPRQLGTSAPQGQPAQRPVQPQPQPQPQSQTPQARTRIQNPPSTPTATPPPNRSGQSTVPKTMGPEEIKKWLAELSRRYEQYKSNYEEHKSSGDTANAKSCLLSMKALGDAAQAIKEGKPIDASKLPAFPGPMLSQATPAITVRQPEARPSPSFAERQMTDLWDKLEGELKEQIRGIHERAMKLKDSKVQTERKRAVELHKEQKRQLEVLRTTLEDRAKGAPPPRYHYETRQEQQEILFSHLRDNEMEVEIVGCSNLHVPHEISNPDAYVYALCPFPNATSPQKIQTSSVSGTVDPVYNFTGKFEIERKKSFLFFCQRKKLVFEIWHKRLLRHVQLGRAEVDLSGLLTKSEVHVNTQILKPTGRRPTEGILEAFIRLRMPLQQRDIRVVEYKELVIDGPSPLPVPSPVPLSPAPTETPPPSPAPTVGAAPAVHRDPEVILTPMQTPATSPKYPTLSPVTTPPVSSTTTTTTTTTTTAPIPTATSTTPAKPAAAEPAAPEIDLETYDPDSVDNIVSNELLESELKKVDTQLQIYASQKKTPPEELVDRKQEIELKINLLVLQVETGQLTQEAYVERLKEKIVEERNMAKELAKLGKRDWAKMALARVKVMQKELDEGGQGEEG